MVRLRFILTSVMLSTPFLVGCKPQLPKSDSAPSPKSMLSEDAEKYLQARRDMAQRTNGVLLSATAKYMPGTIRITWRMDYDGPRLPLIIQKPIYPKFSFEATRISIILPDAPDSVRSCIITAPPIREGTQPPLGEEDYLRVEKGRTVSGELTIPVAKISSAIRDRWPELKERSLPTALYIQLQHFPWERGELYKLDAWTGELFTPPMKVENIDWGIPVTRLRKGETEHDGHEAFLNQAGT